MRRLLALGLLFGAALSLQGAIPTNLRATLVVNPDGTFDTRYRNGDKPPNNAILECDDSAAPSLTGLVTGNAYSADVRQYFSGTAAATATLTVVTVSGDNATSEGWAISSAGAGNNLTHSGSGTGSGGLLIRGTTASTSKDCSIRSWSYVPAPSSDTTAPTVPTGLVCTAGSGNVTCEWDASSDPYVSEAGSGVDEYDLRKDGVVVHTVTTGVSPSTVPQLTASTIGTASNTSANQTGTNWTLTSRGVGFTGAADNGYFLGVLMAGDVTITAKIASFDTSLSGAQCGPMIRSSLNADAVSGFILQSSDVTNVGIRTKARTVTAGGFPNLSTTPAQGAPNWLQLHYSAGVVTYSYSTDGNKPVSVASTTLPLASSNYVGIGIASGTTGTTVTCAIEQLSITTVPRMSYTYTTGTTGTYTLRARDVNANNSAYGAGVSGTPLSLVAQIKWHPGHYVRADANTGATLFAADLAAINANAAVKGAEIQYNWATLEPTKNNYDFSVIDGHLSQMGSKRLIIHLVDRTFSGTSCSVLPTYLLTEPGAEGACAVKAGNTGVVARQWLPAVMDRWIALSNALAAQYDTNPRVEMILVLKESSPGGGIGDGTQCNPTCYTRASWAAQYIRAAQASALVWTHTNKVARSNFLSSQLSAMIAAYNLVGVGHGGPDVPPLPHVETIAGKIWRGLDADPSSAAIVNYLDSLPVSYIGASTPYATNGGKDDKPDGTGYDAQEFYDHFVDNLHGTHLSWVRREAGTAPWTSGILPVIVAHPNTTTICPTLYAGNCDTTDGLLAHGDSSTIVGTGFGTKLANAPNLWDDASHGQSLGTRWGYLWHDGEPSDAYREDYWTPAQFGQSAPNDVQLPHSNVTKYLAGAHYSTPAHVGPPPDAFPSAVLVGNSYTRPAFPYYTSWSYYLHLSPNWQFPSGDHNHKWFAFANGGGPYPGNGQNWYLEKENSTFSSTSAESRTHIVADDGSLSGSGQLGSLGEYNETQAWVKIEVLAKITDQANGWIKVYSTKPGVGRRQTFNYAGNTDAWSGTTRFEGIGGYSRHYPYSQNRRYWADVYNDRQTSGNARLVLTNNATFDSSTIVEWQPYTAWSNTSITFTVNKGLLPSGTAHLHLRDDVNGNQYLGPVILNHLWPGLVLPFRRKKKAAPVETLKRAA